MDIKEKRKQYYLNNKEKLLTYSKQYYYDNRNARLQYYYNNLDVRKKYNNEYWALHGQKYLEQRSKDNKLKLKHREYNNNIYSERPKHIHQNNYYNPTLKKDFVVSFPSYDST